MKEPSNRAYARNAYLSGWSKELAEFVRKSRRERDKCEHEWKPRRYVVAGWRFYCENCGAQSR